MKKIAKYSAAILCVSALSSFAFAAKPGFYLGAGLGGGKVGAPDKHILGDFDSNLVKTSQNEKGLAGRVFTGFNLNEYLGFEAGIAKYATSRFEVKVPALSSKTDFDQSVKAVDVVAKAYLPIQNSGFNLYALGGVAYVNSKMEYKTKIDHQTVDRVNQTENELRPKYGIGASYDIPESNLTASLEYSRIQGKGDLNKSASAIPNADLLTFNLSYSFD